METQLFFRPTQIKYNQASILQLYTNMVDKRTANAQNRCQILYRLVHNYNRDISAYSNP